MIDKEVQARLERILQGKEPRDREWEDRQAAEGRKMETGRKLSISEKAEERRLQVASKTPEQREMEQREFSLKVYGRAHMEKFARPLTGLGPLAVPGDQLQGHAQIKGHNGVEPCRGPDGRLRLQNHAACPQRQVLQLL